MSVFDRDSKSLDKIPEFYLGFDAVVSAEGLIVLRDKESQYFKVSSADRKAERYSLGVKSVGSMQIIDKHIFLIDAAEGQIKKFLL